MSSTWYPNGLQIGARRCSETRKLVNMMLKNMTEKASKSWFFFLQLYNPIINLMVPCRWTCLHPHSYVSTDSCKSIYGIFSLPSSPLFRWLPDDRSNLDHILTNDCKHNKIHVENVLGRHFSWRKLLRKPMSRRGLGVRCGRIKGFFGEGMG